MYTISKVKTDGNEPLSLRMLQNNQRLEPFGHGKQKEGRFPDLYLSSTGYQYT